MGFFKKEDSMTIEINEAYHGTLTKNANKIVSDARFNAVSNPYKVTNDLGNGIYTYCSDELGRWDPKKNAYDFAYMYKMGNELNSKKCSVIRLFLSEGSCIDFDSPKNKKIWSKLYKAVKYRAEQILANYPDTAAKRRHNIDGIIIEIGFTKNVFKDVDIVVKETYTAFPKGSRSNFPNGRECLIRHAKIINHMELVK